MPLLFALVSLLSFHVRAAFSAHCSSTTPTRTFEKCVTLPTQQASMAWTFHPHNATLDLVFFGTFISPSGWVGWGINPSSAEMTGTRSLIAFPDPNSGQLVLLPFILDPEVKLQKSPPLSRPLDIHLLSSSATLYGGKMATVHSGAAIQIYATLKLVPNKTKTSLRVEPWALRSSAAHRDDTRTLKIVHGFLNAVSWGVLLPIGAATARYLRHVQALGPAWKLGFAAFSLGALQTLALLFRPKTTNKFRKYWKSYHHFVGYACVVLGVVNVFQGFEVMGESRKSKEEKLRREGLIGGGSCKGSGSHG
ncbi:CYTOCHROME B561 AND DOMON DOMAIN-CONTAINING PROTEIN [Salix purpurea]|uniref:CYTOCHROME B561 AND DOMON DOMAIN-CONTAINING PROTEIN n=1 Tax=Salix purpurea TaxID=77065 RepID=A0A9Q0P2V8_SALPP|nr:CYTOCHROME B561 AND DOMON DOMAIN-CONTAINING PROTEIN [Salix purpurea]